jgi:O-antigen/teichoic acid export membrane protein
MVLGLVSSVILARVLQPEGRGGYAMVLFFSSVMSYYFTFGFGQAAIFHVGKGLYDRAQVLGNTLTVTMFLSLASMCVGGAVIYFYSSRLFPSVDPAFLWLGLGVIPVQLTSGILTQLALAIHNVRIYTVSLLMKGGGTLIAMVIFLAVFNGGVKMALTIEIAASLIVCVYLWFVLRWEAGPLDYRVHFSYIRQAFRFGLSTYVGTTLMLFHYRVDVFLINVYLSASQVGFYSLSASLAEKISFVSDGISTILFPRLAAEKNRETVNHLTPVVLRAVLLSLCLMGGGLFLLGYVVTTTLYGVSYAPAVTPLRVLLIGTVSAGAWGILESDIKSRGFPLFGFFTTLVSALVNVVLNVMWIPRYGITGAASATAISYAISFGLGLGIFCRLSGQTVWQVLVPTKNDIVLYRDIAKKLWQEARA